MQAIIKTKYGSRFTIKPTAAGYGVTGDGDETLAKSLARMATVAAADYSPAFGSMLAYVAAEVARGVGGEVVSVTVPESADPPGTVY
jgi:hypothetical protein